MVHLGKLEHPLLDQMEVYNEMREELECKYFGRWIIIDGGQLVGNYETFQEAWADAQEKGLNPLNYLVRRVGVAPLPLPLLIPSEWKN